MAACFSHTALKPVITGTIIGIHNIGNKGDIPSICGGPAQGSSAVYMIYFAGLVIVVIFIFHETI